MGENVYGCIYFASDKTVSVVLKSRCILRGEFKQLGEVEVKWRVQGKQQIFLGVVLRVGSKGEYNLMRILNNYYRNCLSLDRSL